MKLGDKVKCSGYISKTGNYYLKDGDDVYFQHKRGEVPIEYEKCEDEYNSYYVRCEGETCNRFIITHREFKGVYVGNVSLYTEIVTDTDAYEHPMIYSYKKKPFAIVYYALGKKRLVPLEMIKEE